METIQTPRYETLGALTLERIDHLRAQNILPTIKVIFYDEHSRVVFFVSDKAKHQNKLVANLPGGGIEVGETAEVALRREIKEELAMSDSFLVPKKDSRILTFGTVATGKKNWQAKGVFIIAQQLTHHQLTTLRGKAGELKNPIIFGSGQAAADWLASPDVHIPLDVVSVYQAALVNL